MIDQATIDAFLKAAGPTVAVCLVFIGILFTLLRDERKLRTEDNERMAKAMERSAEAMEALRAALTALTIEIAKSK